MNGSDRTNKGIVAERLDRLFATVTPLGRPYTLREAADGINAQAGTNVVTFQYLSHLRSGLKKNPSYEKLQAIARWFGVSADYFADPEAARRTDEEIRVLDLMRDPRVRRVAFLAEGLGPDDLKLAVGILKRLREIGRLPAVHADGSDEEPVTSSEPEFRQDA